MKRIRLLIFMLLIMVTACSSEEITDDNQNVDENNEEITDDSQNVDENNEDITDDSQNIDENNEENNDVGLTLPEDGTYEGLGEPWEYGQESAKVTIENGKITEVVLARLDTEGNDVTEEYTGQEVDGKEYPDLLSASQEMANEMVNQQTYEVDTIAGATISSENWIVATRRAIEDGNNTDEEN